MQLEMLAPGSYAWTGQADPIRYYRIPIIGTLFRRRVVRCVSLLPTGRRVLEVGYGSGVSFLNLGRRFSEIHGLDLHEHGDAVARSFAGRGLNLRLRQGTITALPYADGYFDAALAVSIHEELPGKHQDAAFSEIRRVLRPGGCYVVGVPGVNFAMNTALLLLGCDVGHYHVTTEKNVLAKMEEHFDVDVTTYLPRFLPASLTTYVRMRGWKR